MAVSMFLPAENIVCVKLHGMTFTRPIRLGEIARFEATPVYAGRSSIFTYICAKVGEEKLIEEASFLAMEAGADFIKTSTGKMQPAATPEAARIMCRCIRTYHERTGRMVGFKPAGGISTPEDAVTYWNIVAETLGEAWLDKRYFRFGASRMANNLLSALEGETVKYY